MSAKIPSVVYQQSFVNQTSALIPITVVTPNSGTTYRLSMYFEQGSGATFAFGRFDWTDDSGAQSKSGSSASPGEFDQMSVIARATSGNPVTFQVTASGTINYSVYVIVEEL